MRNLLCLLEGGRQHPHDCRALHLSVNQRPWLGRASAELAGPSALSSLCTEPSHENELFTPTSFDVAGLSTTMPSLLLNPPFSLPYPPPPFPQTHRLPPHILGAGMMVQGEGCCCCCWSCWLQGDQQFLVLFLKGVQQSHILSHRSSCLDEYLPKSLRYLAVSLQKGPAPFVW